MLVLTRRRNGQIFIGEDIVITVVSVERGNVRIGIEAPENVRILRDDVSRGYKPPKHRTMDEAPARMPFLGARSKKKDEGKAKP